MPSNNNEWSIDNCSYVIKESLVLVLWYATCLITLAAKRRRKGRLLCVCVCVFAKIWEN